ncbi:hypothetical protein IAD21_01187 [Abditibacteriota bacterium]|nr:hypothetical protein IAD21_01187 [Abditibacteriota bacterium]
MNGVPTKIFCCLGVGLLLAGCGKAGTVTTAPQLDFKWQTQPNPPQTGLVNCTLSLLDEQKQPVTGAKIHLEGGMSHPGMQPSLTDMKEAAPGKYTAKLDFTMGGDWFVLVDATLSDGRLWHQQINVPGVKSR